VDIILGKSCFLINPLALRALPLKGEKNSALKYNST